MELNELQHWIGTLYDKIKTQKEAAEYEEYLLDEVTDPWPLLLAPESLQESYTKDISKQKEKENELLKLSEFDKELKTVDDILQKARLLYDNDEKLNRKGTNAKVDKQADISEPKKVNKSQKPINKMANSKPNSASGKPKPGRAPVAVSRTSRVTKGASLAKTRPTSTGKQVQGTRKAVNTNKVANFDPKTARHALQTKPTSASQQALSTRPIADTENVENLGQKVSTNGRNTPSLTSQKEKERNAGSQQSADPKPDLSKIKLSFTEVSKHLDLPQKTKKLLTTRSKLSQQNTESWKQLPAEEELFFIRNLHGKSSAPKKCPNHILTLQSLNIELCQCLKVCTNAVNALKMEKKQKFSPGNRQNLEYFACYNSHTLKLAEEVYYYLCTKYQHLYNCGVVQHDHRAENFTDNFDSVLLASNFDDLTGFGNQELSPEPSFTYEHHTEALKSACERLKHKFLITEREVLRKISCSFYNLLEKLSKNETGSLPSSEFIHLLQSAYGLLVVSNHLLPAYVIAE